MYFSFVVSVGFIIMLPFNPGLLYIWNWPPLIVMLKIMTTCERHGFGATPYMASILSIVTVIVKGKIDL